MTWPGIFFIFHNLDNSYYEGWWKDDMANGSGKFITKDVISIYCYNIKSHWRMEK